MRYAPELAWRLAARDFGYTWERFCALSGTSQSAIVAAYMADKQIEAVLDNDRADKMKAASRRKNAPR